MHWYICIIYQQWSSKISIKILLRPHIMNCQPLFNWWFAAFESKQPLNCISCTNLVDWLCWNLILSQLDSDWKIITFLISPFPCTIVGLWVLGNCRGINCGQILSLNKTCSNSSGNPTHKSHSYPFPPTPPAPASERHKLFQVSDEGLWEWNNVCGME